MYGHQLWHIGGKVVIPIALHHKAVASFFETLFEFCFQEKSKLMLCQKLLV